MKKLSLPITAVLILVALLIYSQECKRSRQCPPDGYILIKEGFIDSLQKIADMPPDTVTNTLFTKGDIVYLPGKDVPVPVPVDPQTNFYTDSIVNDSVSVWVDLTVKGTITGWDWRYSPTIHKTEIIIEKPVPYPVPVPFEVTVRKSGLYGSVGVGGNGAAFILSGEVDLITRKDNIYGLQYLRFDQKSFYLFKIGTKIKLKK